MQKNYKRKTYYIKNSAQSKFISRFVIISLLGGIAAVSAFNFLSFRKIDSVLYSMRLPKISPGGLLWNEMLYTNIFVIVFILIVFAITARGLYVRIHGPLKKMTSDINKVGSGDLSLPIFLREKDEFKDFANELNHMVEELNNKFSRINEANKNILSVTGAVQDDQDAATCINDLNKSIKEIEKTLGSFKI